MIHDMITLIIAYCEIDKFRSDKVGKYHTAIKECSENETVNNQNLYEYWSIIFENAHNAENSR